MIQQAHQDPYYSGLTAAEVAERIRRGQVNRTTRPGWFDYAAIIRRNLVTVFNLLITPAAISLFFLENYKAAIAVSGMAIVNTVIGLVQEIKAKRHLDKLAILVETRVRVRRDGRPVELPASEVVLGDLVLVSNGDSIVADGTVIESRYLEVDEALLTGESDPVLRHPGDQLLSGSFCVAGEGSYRADRVGRDAFAQSTSAKARHYRYTPSPLTRIINLLIQILTYTAVGLCALHLVLWRLGLATPDEAVKNMAATITSMVPQGLVLMATVSFTLGAVIMSRRGAIVQRLQAVESMAAIDVICTDKTGTLTTNRLQLDQIRPLGNAAANDDGECQRLLRLFVAASADRKNKSLAALRTALGEEPALVLDRVPFKSHNRYSAVRLRDGSVERVLALGAPEALAPYLDPVCGAGWQTVVQELIPSGLRLLLFAEQVLALPAQPFDGSLRGFMLRPVALVALSDELRPEAGQVLEALAAQGIDFKVISGDHPETVRATVSHLQLPLAHQPVVTGDDLVGTGNAEALIERFSVFGRVSPEQKLMIVETLQRQKRHVAMIGDGVNDVLPIKRSDLGIAMGEGSQAAKTVAGLVLETNNFALLPETLEEGRTILRNLRRSAKLFLVKNVYSLILILAYGSGLLGVPFPYEPQQVTLLNWLVIGMPAFVIALSRERSAAATRPRFLREVGWFALRSGIIFALAGLAILLLAVHVFQYEPITQKTLLLSVLILLGISALLRALRDGEAKPLRGDTRFRWLACAAMPVYLASMYLPFTSDFFLLTPLTIGQWLLVVGVVSPAVALSLLSDLWCMK